MKKPISSLIETLIFSGFVYIISDSSVTIGLWFTIILLLIRVFNGWHKHLTLPENALRLLLPLAVFLPIYFSGRQENNKRHEYTMQNLIVPVQQFYAQHHRYPRVDEIPTPPNKHYAYNRNARQPVIETVQYQLASEMSCFNEYHFHTQQWHIYCW